MKIIKFTLAMIFIVLLCSSVAYSFVYGLVDRSNGGAYSGGEYVGRESINTCYLIRNSRSDYHIFVTGNTLAEMNAFRSNLPASVSVLDGPFSTAGSYCGG